ncbi:MAG: substrate-binding domain-containing protein, partial [Candidatus Scatosoma sp.]
FFLGEYLKEHEVDGIFAFNDMIAYETLHLLKKLNRQDVRVVGFDNIQELFKFPVKISTIGADKTEMAKTAVQVLLEKINNSDERAKHRIFDVFLITEDAE